MRSQYSSMDLSPSRREPLIVPGSASLDAMASGCMAVSLRVVSAVDLRPMKKGITSNPLCEVALVHDDGHTRYQSERSYTWDATARTPNSKMSRSFAGQTQQQQAKEKDKLKGFRTPIVKSSLNPIWNFDVDFGDVDTESVVGVCFTVRHVEKFGLVKKDIGQLVLSLREVMDLSMQPMGEGTFHLNPTQEMSLHEQHEESTSRKYGKLTLRFNNYGITSTPAQGDYTTVKAMRPSSMIKTVVAHEDNFSMDQEMPKHDIRSEVLQLQQFHQARPNPGETWFAINAQWIIDWLLFVSKHKGENQYDPGAIDNMPLISDDLMDGTLQVRTDLAIKKDFRLINRRSWEFYQSKYGGGPVLQVKIPRDCANTSEWVASLRLHEVARVGSGYMDSDSE